MSNNPIPNSKPFPKGVSGNPNGRPRKFVSTLKGMGYKNSEVADSIQSMLAMTLEELKDIYQNPESTVLEKTVAGAIKKSIEKGDLHSIEILLSRVFGKPKESVKIDSPVPENSPLRQLTLEELKALARSRQRD
jgi:hypothetical protein